MCAISEEEAQLRRDYYHDNNIGWVARPKHEKGVFERKGKFKKASNMNFALNVANKVEDYLQKMMDEETSSSGSEYVDDEKLDEMYRSCLDRVLDEDARVKAAGNVRMGEIILIIDSDTRVVSSPSQAPLIH
jgi:predicted ATP-dependent Lon-type protease